MNQPRILIVEDEVVVAMDIGQQVRALGYEAVAETRMGEEAVLLAGQLQPDLVLMDVNLAGEMDGIAAAEVIRNRFSIPVVFLTAFTSDLIVSRAKLVDPLGYICKPFQKRELRTIIEIALFKRQAEIRQREIHEEQAAILRTALDGYWMVDMQGRILEVNDAGCRIHGYTREEMLRMAISDFETDATPAEIVEQIQRTRRAGSCRSERTHRCKDGSLVDLEISSNYRPTSGGRLIAFLRDITERKRLEALNRQLQKSESLGRMAGAIAHHFNNQLQAVLLSLEMAMSGQPPNEAPAEGLAQAMRSTRRAAEVSTLMLTYLGQAKVENAPLDLAEVCRRRLPLLRVAMPQNVVLATDLPTPGPVISANANQLQQVLTVLMTNAWEASEEGRGAIRLSVKTVSAAEIPAAGRFPINWQPQDCATAYACLEVADEGGGIAAEDLDKLFDPFFSTKFTGRGLGLPVVLGIARSHDGVVTVRSESSRGSTFRFFIPVAAKALPQQPVLGPVSPISQSVRRGTTVLVVDDEPIVRTTLALVLRRSAFSVLEAEDGVAAVEVFRQHRDEIGCVVCDLTMPRMNGWETLTAMRQLVPGIPVIIASGYSETQVMVGDHPEQPQAFLHKPYEAKVLIDAINQILANKNE